MYQANGTESLMANSGVAELGLIATPGAQELTALIDRHLVVWAREKGVDRETDVYKRQAHRESEQQRPAKRALAGPPRRVLL